PYAGDRVEDNLNPIGRAYYAASTLICTPCSLSQEVGLALGAQAGEARTREVVTSGGFTRFRAALATPVHLIYEARPLRAGAGAASCAAGPLSDPSSPCAACAASIHAAARPTTIRIALRLLSMAGTLWPGRALTPMADAPP